MSRTVRKQLFSTLESLNRGNQVLNKLLMNGKTEDAASLLVECQECAIAIGTQIDEVYGEDTESVHALEEYCELIYQLSESLNSFAQRKQYYELLCTQWKLVHETMEREIPDKLEVVFLPYKASMWDSLESVYLAAREDENCDAYVVPIPYFDKKPDGSFGEMHYEGDEYPQDIPVTAWQEYDMAKRYPDMIFIHNPYDEYNNVTSVHPYYYSKNLKKFTDTLVYIPYYSTTGGMSEGQKKCSAYYYADYIIMQAEKYRKFFDPALPQEKLLPLGTPKFDRVIRICNNPPEPPTEWINKMEGKKVYFYNTSLNGMLQNTPAFLRKMEYVFSCFAGREDACLLWRPHPLMESTFDSMRAQYKTVYEALKKYFIESNLGIYDETPDITNTIALCDAYIGDSGTSVTSLFGIAGKPLFILDNNINTRPEEDDWRGAIVKGPINGANNDWMVTQGNKLYYSPEGNYHYQYFCDLNEYSGGMYYSHVITIQGKHYVCPLSAQNILVIGEKGIEKKIELKRLIEQRWAFYGALSCEQYLFLLPNNYPEIVKYDTVTEEVTYITDFPDIFRAEVSGAKRLGGSCVKDGFLYMASPVDNRILVIQAENNAVQLLSLETSKHYGTSIIAVDGEDLWLLPYTGNVVTRWNPQTGELREYTDYPTGIQCKHPTQGYEFDDRPFSFPALYGEYVYFPPYFGNMYVKLNKQTGEMIEWKPPFEQPESVKNGYYVPGIKSYFWGHIGDIGSKIYRMFSAWDKKMYDVNLETEEYCEVEIVFDKKELKQNEAGFQENSEWLQYACEENAFNSLPDFLDGNITGNKFDKERQIKSFGTIAANHDGSCGEKIYHYMCESLARK